MNRNNSTMFLACGFAGVAFLAQAMMVGELCFGSSRFGGWAPFIISSVLVPSFAFLLGYMIKED